jgi:outer membrane lipoprotein carrier protein
MTTRAARWTVAVALLGALGTIGTPATAQDAAAALARAERAYRAAPTLAARFEQTIVNPMLGGPEHSSGSLFLERPARFAMRFDEPVGDRIVADGEWLWAYTPSAAPGQVFRQSVPSSGPATPNLFGQFVDRPLERYTAEWVRADTVDGAPVDVVRLTPRTASVPFRSAELALDGAGLLRWLMLVEGSRQRREMRFFAIRPGADIPTAEFQFTPPPGVRIVTP